MGEPDNKEQNCLDALRKYVKSDSLFNDLDDVLTDEFLLAFVRGRKYDIKKARKTLYTFIHLRRVDYRDYFQTLIPSRVKHAFDVPVRVQGVLKNRDPKGRYVGIERIGIWDPDWISAEKGSQLLLLYGLEAMKSVEFQKEGAVIILDAAHSSLKHMKCLNFPMIKMLSSITLDSMPVRYRELHVVNYSSMVDVVMPMVKLLLSRKLRQRIQMHPTLESLHNALPREILPESLGGSLTDEEAFDSGFEQRIIDSETHYVQLAKQEVVIWKFDLEEDFPQDKKKLAARLDYYRPYTDFLIYK